MSQSIIESLKLLAHSLGRLLDFLDAIQTLAKKYRTHELICSIDEIGLRFTNRTPDQAHFLGCPAEDWRLGIAAIQIRHDRERLVQDKIVVLQGRHLASRIEPQIICRLMFAFGELQTL